MTTRYRVGRKLGRTIYRDDVLIGMMDTPEDANSVVRALNNYQTSADVHALRDRLSMAATQVKALGKELDQERACVRDLQAALDRAYDRENGLVMERDRARLGRDDRDGAGNGPLEGDADTDVGR